MNIEEIDVFIDPDGQVRIEVRGVKGQNCLSITKPLEQLLGGKVIKREMTSEASETQCESVDDVQFLG